MQYMYVLSKYKFIVFYLTLKYCIAYPMMVT
jgi:hypothetical protein